MVASLEVGNYKWKIVYNEAYNHDGSLYFPQRLNKEFLENKKKVMGSYLFANQYLNRVIPDDEQDFKKDWLKYYHFLPQEKHTFITIDPAISLNEGADFTAFCVVHVDPDNNWYVQHANRAKITATQTVELIFELFDKYKPMIIGVEAIAYQQALIHFLTQEMRRRNVTLPLKEIKSSRLDLEGGKKKAPSKFMKIRSLVPRFEWGQIFLNQGLSDFEIEYSSFPRGRHDDILDALSMIGEIAFAPKSVRRFNREPEPNDPGYERWYIGQLAKRNRQR